jgi:hypothetical protein
MPLEERGNRITKHLQIALTTLAAVQTGKGMKQH